MAGRSGKRRRRRGQRRASVLRPVLLWGTLGLGLGLVAWLGWLDHRIRVEFEGARWAVPARVWSRPLELYGGVRVGPQRLRAYLEALGYRAQGDTSRPGTMAFAPGTARIATRGFRFWDGPEPPRRLRVRWKDGVVSRLLDLDSGAELPLVRLEPVPVASIHPLHGEDRILVRRADLPDRFVSGLLAVEDRRFRSHHGVDPMAILRALLADLRAGAVVQGGSTLTQQLVKNFFLDARRSLGRKLTEAAMALLLELHYDKDEILEAYANEVYLGQEGTRAIHGFGLAARHYFGRPLQELELHQWALLIGMIRGPSLYDPLRHPERARQRRNRVLAILAGQGVVSPAEAQAARRRPLGLAKGGLRASQPAYVDLVLRGLRGRYPDEVLGSAGLQIFSAFDPWIQSRVEAVLASMLPRLERRGGLAPGTLQAAVVVSRVSTGEVVAVAGGRDPRFQGFNRALEGRRSVGSLIKPAVYLTALMDPARYTLVTPLDDSPMEVRYDDQLWQPANYDGEFHGRVPLYRALARSYNVATARLGLELGVGRVIRTLRSLGMEARPRPWPSLLLGAVPLSPLEVTQIYQTVADGGFRTPLRAVMEVVAADGRPVERYPLATTRAVDERADYLLVWALRQTVAEGTARALGQWLEGPFAGKTGTTDGLRDSWFAGFGGDYVAVVWLGADDNRGIGLSGSSGALRVFGELFRRIGAEPLALPEPDGIVWHEMDVGAGCGKAVRIPFIDGSAPEDLVCGEGPMGWLRRLLQ